MKNMIAIMRDPKAIEPILLKDLAMLLQIGQEGSPYSKYQIATEEQTQ